MYVLIREKVITWERKTKSIDDKNHYVLRVRGEEKKRMYHYLIKIIPLDIQRKNKFGF